MTDLADLVPSLQRAVAPPGRFAATFPEATDELLVGQLADGIARAQLDGMLSSFSVDEDGIATPDLTAPQGALAILYASTAILKNEIRNRKTHVRYEAAGNVFEEDQSAQTLVQLLKDMQGELAEIVKRARLSGLASAFYMTDLAYVKDVAEYGWTDFDAHNYNAVPAGG